MNVYSANCNIGQLAISSTKRKSMAMWGNHIQRVKIVINDNIIEQVTDFKYLGYRISEYKSKELLNEFKRVEILCLYLTPRYSILSSGCRQHQTGFCVLQYYTG